MFYFDTNKPQGFLFSAEYYLYLKAAGYLSGEWGNKCTPPIPSLDPPLESSWLYLSLEQTCYKMKNWTRGVS